MPLLALIAGPSGAGKTSLCKTLVRESPLSHKAVYISSDDIYNELSPPQSLNSHETPFNHAAWRQSRVILLERTAAAVSHAGPKDIILVEDNFTLVSMWKPFARLAARVAASAVSADAVGECGSGDKQPDNRCRFLVLLLTAPADFLASRKGTEVPDGTLSQQCSDVTATLRHLASTFPFLANLRRPSSPGSSQSDPTSCVFCLTAHTADGPLRSRAARAAVAGCVHAIPLVASHPPPPSQSVDATASDASGATPAAVARIASALIDAAWACPRSILPSAWGFADQTQNHEGPAVGEETAVRTGDDLREQMRRRITAVVIRAFVTALTQCTQNSDLSDLSDCPRRTCPSHLKRLHQQSTQFNELSRAIWGLRSSRVSDAPPPSMDYSNSSHYSNSMESETCDAGDSTLEVSLFCGAAAQHVDQVVRSTASACTTCASCCCRGGYPTAHTTLVAQLMVPIRALLVDVVQ